MYILTTVELSIDAAGEGPLEAVSSFLQGVTLAFNLKCVDRSLTLCVD